MAQHIETGKTGEDLAAIYLKNIGYTILEQNWRYSRFEVDFIASKNQVLHFVEVKTRKSRSFGLPEDAVTKKKIRNLMAAAEEYLYQQPQWQRIQFDVLSITLSKGTADYFLIEDVFV